MKQNFTKGSETAQLVKVLAAKLEFSELEWWKERTDFYKQFSDLHTYTN